ncbi:MAG TPA: M14 family metallopeptidase [Thermoanaerobaculia bacterium]|nr:M14 family metallopeptidase [Thermoanaerobaculia bacterium]
MRAFRFRPALAAAFVLALALPGAAAPPAPAEHLGLAVGADRTLADWGQIVSYFRALDAASDRVEVTTIGTSTRGEEMILAAISSPENLANQRRLREVARRLADPRGLSPAEEKALLAEGKAVLLVTCGIHASEIGASQMAMEWAHALATAEDAETKRRLSEVVLLLVPSLNPDGHRMEVDWYRKNLGTRWEGSRMPWLYHHYVGHDNNRDFAQLTQAETRAISRVLYHDWFPQVFLDEHQMGTSGPRMFVPPYADPLDPDIDPLVIREVNMIGSLMSMRLEQAGKSGVISAWAFDVSWPGGSKNTAWWKNVTGVLTEVASVRLATPIEVPPTELRGGGKGLVEYGPQVNFPNPWRGGKWRLRDVMDY